MQIGVCKFTLRIPASRSLKGKRKVVSSLCARIKNQFNVAITEVENNDVWQIATLGFCCVSNNKQTLEILMSQVLNFIQTNAREYLLVDYKKEIIAGF